MLNIQKILVPIVFTDTSRHVVHQAAWLARRFHAEMILLHVVTASQLSRRRAGERGRDHRAGFARAHRPAGSERSGSGDAAGARWDCGHTRAAQGRPGPRNREDGSRPERRPDRDVDSWLWGVLPLSAGLSDSEGTARKPLPGLDRRSPGRGAGTRVLDPPRPLLGGFEPSQPPHRVAGRRDGRGRRCNAYARPHHGQRGGLWPRRIPRRPRVEGDRSSASPPKRSPSFSRTWARRPKSSSIAAMFRSC